MSVGMKCAGQALIVADRDAVRLLHDREMRRRRARFRCELCRTRAVVGALSNDLRDALCAAAPPPAAFAGPFTSLVARCTGSAASRPAFVESNFGWTLRQRRVQHPYSRNVRSTRLTERT